MESLLQALYIYACERRAIYSHEERLKCHQSACTAERAQKEIMDMLPEAGQSRFKDYIEEEHLLEELELESMFRAGLAIGLELSRLH